MKKNFKNKEVDTYFVKSYFIQTSAIFWKYLVCLPIHTQIFEYIYKYTNICMYVYVSVCIITSHMTSSIYLYILTKCKKIVLNC